MKPNSLWFVMTNGFSTNNFNIPKYLEGIRSEKANDFTFFNRNSPSSMPQRKALVLFTGKQGNTSMHIYVPILV